MRAPVEVCSRRGVVAVLASGVVISLTGLTGGIAPALAKPDHDPVVPTTEVVVPESEPEVRAPKQEQRAPKYEDSAPAPEVVIPGEVPVQQAPPPRVPVEPPSRPVVEAPPQIEAPQPPPVVEPPTTEAVVTPQEPVAVDPPVTKAPKAELPEQQPAQKPAEEEAAPPLVERQPKSPAAQVPADEAPAVDSPPSPELVVPRPQDADKSEESGKSQVPAPDDAPGGPANESATRDDKREAEAPEDASGVTPSESSTVSQAARVIETAEPETLEAPKEDVELARKAKPVEVKPAPAPKHDVDAISSAIDLGLDVDGPLGVDIDARAKAEFEIESDRDWDRRWARKVRQWDRDWIEYDRYYRPVFCNPYRHPVRIVYIYQYAPRIVIIPPLARIVVEAAEFAAYSFTAVVLGAANVATNIAVGSFFGGGYFPGVGLPLPPPPPRVLRYDNVPVQVRYSRGVYEPFRVRQIVDVGHDARFGERKVLLDGVTPAWGTWTQTPTGERQFEIHKTQQFPGLEDPQEAPLPGDYPLRLASDSSAGFDSKDAFLYGAAGLVAGLGFGALGFALYLGRRRPEH